MTYSNAQNGHLVAVPCQLIPANNLFSTTLSIAWLTKQPTLFPAVQSWPVIVNSWTWNVNVDATSPITTLNIHFSYHSCFEIHLTSSSNAGALDSNVFSSSWSCCFVLQGILDLVLPSPLLLLWLLAGLMLLVRKSLLISPIWRVIWFIFLFIDTMYLSIVVSKAPETQKNAHKQTLTCT